MKKKLFITLCCVCVLAAIFICAKVLTPPTSEVSTSSNSLVVKRIQAKRAKEKGKKKCGCCLKKELRVGISKKTQ